MPAALALLLTATAVVQLMLPPPPLADEVTPGRAPNWRLPDVAPLPGLAGADRASLFSPLRVAAGAATAADGTPAPVGPLDGAFVLGAMRVGRTSAVLLRDGDGRVLRLPPGAAFKGWRLIAITDDDARFRKGAASVRIPFGAAAPAAAQEDESSESEE
ncbi:hypothetical protein [Novosphingobium cyanobacteriorum]|uniref:General secretion pathway protein N n=1 Tax=Novosphingobium cyanobacteriorum TaxID=3024215 RepID=A0ABT6CPX3_9SPHN|nr:hypothetical protein [Novosphingobium cyanobacteriorum]MDF8334367.1 hypothetical protein [Novosphingobium cyanobacteriorum]